MDTIKTRGGEVSTFIHPVTGRTRLEVLCKNGHSDYPIKYDNGNIAYNNPGLIPKDLKKAVERAYKLIDETPSESLLFEYQLDRKSSANGWVKKSKDFIDFNNAVDAFARIVKMFPKDYVELIRICDNKIILKSSWQYSNKYYS